MASQDNRPPLVAWLTTFSHAYVSLLGKVARNSMFRRAYVLTCLLILLGSTVFWAILGARLQMQNADQLSDPYLFTSWQTFHHATFPGAHTFLLKWPIFWLTTLGGLTAGHIIAATVAEVFITVGALAFVLYSIEKRPLVIGTVFLALAAALLLVPAQPYAGGILPVNMAMLTTRNLEYAVYLGVLVLLAKAKRWLDWRFVAAVLALTILIASDKLFLSLSAGGALIALVAYALWSNWKLVSFSVRWLVGSLAAGAAATGLLGTITALKITNLSGAANANPYGFVTGLKDLALGMVYAVLGLFTNTGANPVYDNQVVRNLPGSLVHRLWSISGIAYLLMFALSLLAMGVLIRFTARQLRVKAEDAEPSVASMLAVLLVWSTVAALGVFIGTKHEVQVDARYLAIALFALAVCAVVELRRWAWQWPADLLLVASGLVICISIALQTSVSVHTNQTVALAQLNQRNLLVADALAHHKVDTLVGDYWRVLPIALASHSQQQVTPLANCTQPLSALSSTTWQPNLANHSFAYLVTFRGGLTNFPSCSLAQISAAYGSPNATQIIAGTLAQPDEALLFYDQGAHHTAAPSKAKATPNAILPISLAELGNTNCSQPTVMNVVAHQDDDLLFMSPDLLHEIDAGKCVRTVYLTAGDGGRGRFYWLGRQLGSEAAYSTMLGTPNIWDQQTVSLGVHKYVTIATPHGSSKVSLIFFNLPDGNIHGTGFPSSNFKSLSQLYDGHASDLTSVDGQSGYSRQSLTEALATLMALYQPAAVHTQADVPSAQYPDHSDHIATGKIAQEATIEYDRNHFEGDIHIPVTRYIGYPTHGYPANISDTDLSRKETAFLAYAQYDGGVCHSLSQCDQTATYGSYLARQYTENADEP